MGLEMKHFCYRGLHLSRAQTPMCNKYLPVVLEVTVETSKVSSNPTTL